MSNLGPTLRWLERQIHLMCCAQGHPDFDDLQREYRDYLRDHDVTNAQVLGAWAVVQIGHSMPRNAIRVVGLEVMMASWWYGSEIKERM